LGDGGGSKLVLKINGTNLWSEAGSLVGAWHHVVVVYESGVGAKFYVDGVSAGTPSNYTDPINSNSSNVQIGKWPRNSGRYFDGTIDEVIIYHHALSGSEVQDIFNGEGSSDTTSPIFTGLASATDAQANGAVNLSWSAASDPSTPITYNIYYSTSPGGYGFAKATTQNTSYQVTGLTNGQVYYFVVRAQDVVGNEDDNMVEISATPTLKPVIP
jgi:hypothetical protein